jgi:HK97 gp10 family phage protein
MGDGSVKCTVRGLDELGKQLGENSVTAIKRTLRRVEKECGKIWIEAMQERAPVDTGNLEESITYQTESTEAGMTLYVGPDKGGYYGTFQEFGTRFQSAQPFVRPAFEDTQGEVIDKFGQVLAEELQTLEQQKAQVLDVVRAQLFGG